jgi:hypothetical protein
MSDKQFFDKMFSGRKVERVLKSMGVDTEKFQLEYTRAKKPYPKRKLSPDELEAVDNFLRNPTEENKVSTMRKLRIKTDTTLWKVCVENANKVTTPTLQPWAKEALKKE